jgi:hypothetical protein
VLIGTVGGIRDISLELLKAARVRPLHGTTPNDDVDELEEDAHYARRSEAARPLRLNVDIQLPSVGH